MLEKTATRTLVIGAAAAAGLVMVGGPAYAETEVDEPASFTSAFTVMATPDQVVNPDGVVTPGQPGAAGTYTFRINSDLEIICYDIRLTGVSGDYQSPAKTATHVHEAVAGKPGPPRIAFPNPSPVGDGPRTSSGCLQGPFTTGILVNGVDTGDGFSLAKIEANAAGFAADAHTTSFVAGVVRGQLAEVPVGGVGTGAGGTAEAGMDAEMLSVAVGAAGMAAGVGILALRRHRRAATR